MSGYSLANWFAKLFLSPLSLAEKYIVRFAADSASLLYMTGALGMILKKVFHKISGPARDPSVSD